MQGGRATVYIGCQNAVNYGILNESGYDKLIPENGVLINTTVQLENGDTAQNVIERAAEQTSVLIVIDRGYVKSVSGLAEKKCGGSSGWLYSVNNEFPTVSVDKYAPVNNGDVIRVLYSVKNGDVAQLNF